MKGSALDGSLVVSLFGQIYATTVEGARVAARLQRRPQSDAPVLSGCQTRSGDSHVLPNA